MTACVCKASPKPDCLSSVIAEEQHAIGKPGSEDTQTPLIKHAQDRRARETDLKSGVLALVVSPGLPFELLGCQALLFRFMQHKN